MRSGGVRAKLAISTPGDEYEREADRVAETVLRSPYPGRADIPLKKTSSPGLDPAPSVGEALRSPGEPLNPGARAFFEPRFGRELTEVRVHADAKAAQAAGAVNALAFTAGRDIVFGERQYAPATTEGKGLLAHELAHVLQQGGAGTPMIQRVPCWTGDRCNNTSTPEEFISSETRRERGARARRRRMSPERAGRSGHGGRALQLERFMDVELPGRRSRIHGIFVDWDMSDRQSAYMDNCAAFTPPIRGATRPCIFVPARLNQEAYQYNNTQGPTIGRRSREDWRVHTIGTLTHETQHVIYGDAPHLLSRASCSRADIDLDLDEMSAKMSEFPVLYRAIPPGAGPSDPSRARLARYFRWSISTSLQSITGIVTRIRCTCDCPDSDAYIVDTFNFASQSWTQQERDAYNAELRRPEWGLDWPL